MVIVFGANRIAPLADVAPVAGVDHRDVLALSRPRGCLRIFNLFFAQERCLMRSQEALSKTHSDRRSPLPLITIAIPVCNEADSLDALYERLCRLGETMSGRCTLEFVFTDNHSSDLTWTKLSQLASKDARVRAIRFSKNVGYQRSILANYMHARGDAVMQIDADLQDPPELLVEFFDLWQLGHRVVYGIRRERTEGAAINLFRRLGYWAIDKLSEHPIPRNAGDFRLIDRAALDALTRMNVPSPYLRGMIAGLGFDQIGVPYKRDPRTLGQSKFNVARITQLGLVAIINHSVVPLRLASFVGAASLVISIIGGLYFIVEKIVQPDYPRGFASVYVLLLFGIGLHASLLGVVGEYVLRTYLILRSEPLAIVEHALNFRTDEIRL
ncbi:glycosyltransferase family 2 protein [Bradyrhizobium yuanmingense]|uniref:glycosyltransferase family 2 protein n=1 Tax=Bradyrhizobium yuanmingense TaxID=108015 RepID=UPI0021A41192|nr:glycosyltransferase family 2 protein [Bradyrhizobium sp. CB1024]UWU83200.1 glycosyltransferase family 2 protein [Bradyrhizobium sp. CB1024]